MRGNMLKENGRLSDSGREAVKDFKEALTEILDLDKVKSMQLNELNSLQSNLLSIVKDLFAEAKTR